MLEELHVRDLALIEDVRLEFGPGMTVLTGETGAGKTALVGALKLLVGERADSTLVRAGAQEALVEGRVVGTDGELVAVRKVSADGRSRCWIDGGMATVGQLAEGLGPHFDLHGQHEHQALLSPPQHVGYLDRHIGEAATGALAAYRVALGGYRDAVSTLRRLESELADSERTGDYLRFVTREIEAVAPHPGEDAEIDRRLPMMEHGERLTAAASEAFASLRSDGGAGDALARAQSVLARVAGLDPALDSLTDRLTVALAAVDDIGGEIRDYGGAIEYDPAALNTAQARLSALASLKKKYGPHLDDVIRTAAESAERLDRLECGASSLGEAQDRVATAKGDLEAAAGQLADVRGRAVPGFVSALGDAVSDLAMGGVRFDVGTADLAFEEWTEDGPQRVEFLYAPGSDQPARPLSKIASGGEVSRVMLAMKGVLGKADRVPVLVFDEIDAGIGGATADAVGRRLRQLAADHQVLVITHLAQVAVHGDAHIVVEKTDEDGAVRTRAREIDEQERVLEIARMLSGSDTGTSRAHAEELLASARA
ncbi:MAG: DNA repair protein RecN [Actinomycetota bacterium]|nr:DNA repair protein RecN [Actinomycetota bacterium]